MQGHIAGKQKSLCKAQNCLILIRMLHSLYLCVSQSRAIPVTNIPQSSVVLHHDILILAHSPVEVSGEVFALHIHSETHTLSIFCFVLLLIFRALFTQAENKGGQTVDGCVAWLYEAALKWCASFIGQS